MQSKTTRRTVMLTPAMDDKLEYLASNSGMNPSEYMRKLIQQGIIFKTDIIKEDK